MTHLHSPQAKITIADLEKVPASKIMDMMSEMLRQGNENTNEMLISLNKVPLICFHIESIESNIARIIPMIENNWSLSQEQHKAFITKDQMESFSAVYVSEFSNLKRTILACTSAIMLAVFANFLSRII